MPFNRLLPISGSRTSKRLPLVFECLLCTDKFTVEDVRKKHFYIQTLICKKCYIIGVKTNSRIWCFGKLQKHNSPGFSQENVSCRLLCSDRVICQKFITKNNKEKVHHGNKETR
jgi:hypothetical protein